METTKTPTIEVEEDFDGYFEALVSSWIARKKGPFKHRRIVISAGPYRPHAVSYESKGDALHLDFYSPLRRGFGSLSPEEVTSLIELL